MKIAAIVTSLILLAIAWPSMALSGFQNYRADYVVKYDGVPMGKSTTTFTLKNAQYRLCVDNVTTVPLMHSSVVECSTGILTKTTVQPRYYSYQYQQGDHQTNIIVTFDWQKHVATMQVNGNHWQMKIPDGTQDKLSYQLLLRNGLTENSQHFSFPIADGGKIKTYTYDVVGQENITTPLQSFSTIKLVRAPIPGKENVTLWLAPALNNIAVRVEQNKHIMDKGSAEIINYHA